MINGYHPVPAHDKLVIVSDANLRDEDIFWALSKTHVEASPS
jgi:hypothetical protein